jgi:hypothetical protein
MIWVDDAAVPYKGKPRFHMTASSVKELHVFAQEAGIARCWWHSGAKHPHYDITEEQKLTVMSMGAVEVSKRELVKRANLCK